MRKITVKVHPSSAHFKKKDQLAWQIAEIATDKSKVSGDAIEMVINRIIDNASVAVASFNRKPVISAREMALAHPRKMVQQFLVSTVNKLFIVNGQHGQIAQLLEN